MIPAISIVVPFWNVRPFLGDAVESVLAQTFRGWELLLVDDGSSDGSTDLARRYVDRNPDQIWQLQHETHGHRGRAVSRNLGVRHARGRYVAFLDADDTWFPAKLERQLAILEAEPDAAMVCGPVLMWHSWSGKPEDRDRDRIAELPVGPGLVPPPSLLAAGLRVGVPVPHLSTVLIRHEVLARVGAFSGGLPPQLQEWEDAVFLSKVELREPVYVTPECWSRHRRHERSRIAIMRGSGRVRAARTHYLRWLERYLQEQGVEAAELRDAHQRAVGGRRAPPAPGLGSWTAQARAHAAAAESLPRRRPVRRPAATVSHNPQAWAGPRASHRPVLHRPLPFPPG
jgi:glycosyltransferase involved in cell wall biosynthesis